MEEEQEVRVAAIDDRERAGGSAWAWEKERPRMKGVRVGFPLGRMERCEWTGGLGGLAQVPVSLGLG